MLDVFYLFWLSELPGVGFQTMQSIMKQIPSIKELYEKKVCVDSLNHIRQSVKEAIMDDRLRKRACSKWEEMQKKNIRFLSYWGDGYPSRLIPLYQSPNQLYVRGKLPEEDRISIGIVGARECTCYGRDMARWFGFRLAKNGVCVISGMAKGVDGWAHQGALEAGGMTCAVLGSGVDVCYPREHEKLYHSILKRGAVISEFPMGTAANPGFFPLRNRIISGLSNGILVVEARERSGSLITATQALEQGKDVFVIPGRIGDNLSVGCNRLIRDGAMPVFQPDDILEYYGVEIADDTTQMTDIERKLWDELDSEPKNVYHLSRMTNIKKNIVIKQLIEWKKKKMIQEISQGYFIKV